VSVINKMLQDLDKRNAGGPAAPAGDATGRGVAGVVAPLAGSGADASETSRPLVYILMACVFLAVVALVWQQQRGPVSQPAAPATVALPAPIVVEPVSSPAAVAPTMAAPAAQNPTARTETLAPPPPAPTPVREVVAAGKFESRLAIAERREAPAAPPVMVPSAPVPAPDAAQRQVLAAREALAQAQALWSAGSRDAAVELLQQAMAVSERTAAANGGAPALASLVREWARMELAEGRLGKVWETLSRLEPQLRGEADLWAIRANTAQRLGRHPDSVHAYMAALELRPGESRWMQGAAVSLAALGQLEAAAAMAEKARSAGPISREVQTYLRQMGVPRQE